MNSFKKNKTALAFGLVVLLGVSLSSCDEMTVGNNFLEKPPSLDFTKDSVFTSAQNTRELLWNTYATLPYGLSSWNRLGNLHKRNAINRRGTNVALTDIAVDGAGWSSVSVEWYSGNINATSWWRVFKHKFVNGLHWKAFFQGWTLIENIDQVPDMDQDEKNRLKAEAKIIMALHYVDMFRNIGGVPWINHAFRPDEELQVPRLTVMASVDSISTLIDEAMPHLPTELDNVAQEKGRMTKAAAAGLKTRLLLFAASPLFNSSQPYTNGEAADKEIVWTGGDKLTLWERARDAAKQTIDLIEGSSYYGLEQPASQDSAGYREAFRKGYFDRGTGEVLISTRVGKQHPVPFQLHWNVLNTFGWAAMDCPTHTYAQMFGDENGVPLDKSSMYDPTNPYQNRDPRFYETLTSNASMWGNRPAEMWVGGRERLNKNWGNACAGYRIRKFVFDAKPWQHDHHWPYLRVPEIYLSYAEALNEINGGPTAEAFRYVNMVRNRVGLTDIQNIMDNTSSEEEFRELLLRERVLEMGFENVRWFDMVRRKRSDIFQKELKGMNIYRENDGSFRYEEYSVSDQVRREWKENFSPKWYLDPINNEEVNKEYGVIQNPGWELSGN